MKEALYYDEGSDSWLENDSEQVASHHIAEAEGSGEMMLLSAPAVPLPVCDLKETEVRPVLPRVSRSGAMPVDRYQVQL